MQARPGISERFRRAPCLREETPIFECHCGSLPGYALGPEAALRFGLGRAKTLPRKFSGSAASARIQKISARSKNAAEAERTENAPRPACRSRRQAEHFPITREPARRAARRNCPKLRSAAGTPKNFAILKAHMASTPSFEKSSPGLRPLPCKSRRFRSARSQEARFGKTFTKPELMSPICKLSL